jgi:hypothetical protein
MIIERGFIKMKNKKLFGIFSLMLVLVLSLGMLSAFNFQGRFSLEDEEVQEAISNNDYGSWKELMQSRLTVERFNEIRERAQQREEFRASIQEARENLDVEKMQELKEQFGKGKGMGRKNMNNSECPFSN